jgi:hypothetical protein
MSSVSAARRPTADHKFGYQLSIALYYGLLRVAGSSTCFVFVAETVALVAFGVSWLTERLDLKEEVS